MSIVNTYNLQLGWKLSVHFAAAGVLCTNLSTRLADDSIDTLVFSAFVLP